MESMKVLFENDTYLFKKQLTYIGNFFELKILEKTEEGVKEIKPDCLYYQDLIIALIEQLQEAAE